MRIGVNAQPLVNPLTGIGQYTLAMLKQLVNTHTDVEWVLYASKPLNLAEFNHLPHVTIVVYPTKNKFHRALFISFFMKKILERDHIDVFWSPTHVLPLLKPKHIKCLMSIHDLVYKKSRKTMAFFNAIKETLLFYPSVRAADTILALSKTTRHDLMETFSLKKPPILTYPAYEKPSSSKDDTPALIQGKYILCVCTKEPRKNLDALLQAYLQLPSTLQQSYQLVFAGGRGWKSEAFLQTLDEAKQHYPIINFDYISDEVRNNLYTHATLFVFPTLYEGFGLPVIEAMSYGVPVLTSDIPIMREVGEEAAVYANPLNVSDITAKLQKLLSDPQYLSSYADKAIEHAQRYNSWKPSAEIAWHHLSLMVE